MDEHDLKTYLEKVEKKRSQILNMHHEYIFKKGDGTIFVVLWISMAGLIGSIAWLIIFIWRCL